MILGTPPRSSSQTVGNCEKPRGGKVVESTAITIQSVLRSALDFAHQVLEGTMGGVDDELANRPTGSNANPIGTSYAHVIMSEDAIVNGFLQHRPPLYTTKWAGRTGCDRPMPLPGFVEGDLGEWYHAATVSLGPLRQYAQAVYANSAEFIISADVATLAREIEVFGMKMTVALMFEVFVTGHCNSLAGEISAIKGTFGLKGYPF